MIFLWTWKRTWVENLSLNTSLSGRLEVYLLLKHDPDLQVEGVSARLHLGPVLQVPAGDHLDPLLVLQPAEDDLNDLVLVRLVLEKSARHSADP